MTRLHGVFISYRRSDSAGSAGRIYDRLAALLGPEAVFMDVAGIAPGTDFRGVLDSKLASCSVVLVVMGDTWTLGEAGRRLFEQSDLVRVEVESALACGARVIPLLLDGAVMPSEEQLPDTLKPLLKRQAISLRHDKFADDFEHLWRSIQEPKSGPSRDLLLDHLSMFNSIRGIQLASNISAALTTRVRSQYPQQQSELLAVIPFEEKYFVAFDPDYIWYNGVEATRFIWHGFIWRYSSIAQHRALLKPESDLARARGFVRMAIGENEIYVPERSVFTLFATLSDRLGAR